MGWRRSRPLSRRASPAPLAIWGPSLRPREAPGDLLHLLGLLAITVLGACGNSSSAPEAAGIVPGDSAVYGEVVLDPEGGARMPR